MHHVTKVRFGPTLTEVRTNTESKRPILRYLVNKRPELGEMSPKELLFSDFSCLHSPFSLPDFELAISEIFSHFQNGKKILLYGDRDSDGVSSTCLLAFFLKSNPIFEGINLQVLVSSESDPYGLCTEAMSKIKKEKPDLLITLDFGSSQADEIEQLTKLGMRVIVLDHHEVPVRIPANCALVNPRRLDSSYPEKKICTATLAFKLITGILFYTSTEYNKVYQKKSENGFEYFQNGVLLESKPNTKDELFFEFPNENRNIPVDDARFLFFYQSSKIPGMFDVLNEEIDLAGIGTITDMMPLTSENRHIVKLAQTSLTNYFLSPNKRKGMFALLKELRLNPNGITTKDLGWSIGPVLNCAGRMGKTEEAVGLLLATEETMAKQKAKHLLGLNEERKERTKRNLDRIHRYFLRKPERTNHSVVFCYEPDMEPGVSGIVATKMVNDYKKPAIFIAPDNGDARGSIRSYEKENVLELLESLSHHFLHFGGHPEAGGFSIKIDQIPLFESELYEKADIWLKQNNNPENVVFIDSDFTVLPNEVNENLYKEWKELAPFGQMNPDIKLALKNVAPIHLTPLSGGKHIRFNCVGSGSVKYMIWNKGDEFQKMMSESANFDLVGSLEENFFQGRTTLQFIVEWFGKSEG
ncbi:single-stranded-DNA-specific exonuclease RecJ [Leptospira sp. 96542]|nr:single-stranded-DNA-specific exonuclease RecJ [Leptospira sp. 96542]